MFSILGGVPASQDGWSEAIPISLSAGVMMGFASLYPSYRCLYAAFFLRMRSIN
jgi:hypothetical protein